jgi:hypothetical protein
MRYLYNITVIQDAPEYGNNTITERTLTLTHNRDNLTDGGIVRILRREGRWPNDARFSHKNIVCYA